eukprot:gb/GECG01014909.1/.p1 GENE.gb/GECG01014909.1/~~gb/GECG01014909.1/.p1  ORF type:complete len:485 (+),score=43.88 gb/GECG01014909.1/:1-1455(+)
MVESLGVLLERNGDVSFFLGITCLLMASFSVRKFMKVCKASQGKWNTKMLLMASIMMSSVVRFLTFTTLSIVSFSTNASPDDEKLGEKEIRLNSREQFRSESFRLYIRSIDILINVGDYTFLSAYFLLLVITVETFQLTRYHPFAVNAFRRTGMIVYLVLNTLMYTVQIALYVGALFSSASRSREVMQGVYLLLSVLNVGIPILFLSGYGILSCAFSGYPFRSLKAQSRWNTMIRATCAWSGGRLVWGGFSIFTFLDGWDEIQEGQEWKLTVILVLSFVFAEAIPVTWLLAVDVHDLLAYDDLSKTRSPPQRAVRDVETGDQPRFRNISFFDSSARHISGGSPMTAANSGEQSGQHTEIEGSVTPESVDRPTDVAVTSDKEVSSDHETHTSESWVTALTGIFNMFTPQRHEHDSGVEQQSQHNRRDERIGDDEESRQNEESQSEMSQLEAEYLRALGIDPTEVSNDEEVPARDTIFAASDSRSR